MEALRSSKKNLNDNQTNALDNKINQILSDVSLSQQTSNHDKSIDKNNAVHDKSIDKK